MTPAADPGPGGVPLLWTGGWDSTFQLLRLLLLHRVAVTPYYLVDATRRSTGAEQLAMQRIRAHLDDAFPATRGLIAPTRSHAVTDVPPDSAITRAFAEVRGAHHVGSQYDWLSRFCEAGRIDGLQLAIHRDDKAHAAIQGLVVPCADTVRDGWRMRADADPAAAAAWTLFHRFRLPLLALTKTQMAQVAGQHQGWLAVLGLTWFCHRPRAGMRPCGVCNPCLTTADEGLGWRIPAGRRALGRLKRGLVRGLG